MDNNVVINAPTPIEFEAQQFATVEPLDVKRESIGSVSNIAVDNVAVAVDAALAHEQRNTQILSREAKMFNDSIGTGHVLVKSMQDPNLTKTIFIDNDTIKRSIGKGNLFVDMNGVNLHAIKLDTNIETDPDLMRVQENDRAGSMGLRNV